MSNQQIESAIYSNSNNRTVRTLLMCKVRPSSIHNGIASDYPSAYREIYTGKNGHRYITLGNADAVGIYDTWTVPDTDDTNLGVGSAWFSSLYEDKQQIIFKANEKTNYHPIHLVSNRLYGSRHDKMQVCVITLIYGIRKDAGPWMKEEVSDEHLSSYEAEIQKFMKISFGIEIITLRQRQLQHLFYDLVLDASEFRVVFQRKVRLLLLPIE